MKNQTMNGNEMASKGRVSLWRRFRRWALRYVVSLVLLVVVAGTVTRALCSRGAGGWFENDRGLQTALARQVEDDLDSGLNVQRFDTGSDLFDGEWLFGSYMMAGMGYGQLALLHPEERERCAAMMERCIDRILSREVREFDRRAWGGDAIETLGSMQQHHAAYLGYFNMVLSLHRYLDRDSRYAELNDRITEALAQRLKASPIGLIETYPGQVFPVDNTAVIASIGIYDRATGAEHGALIARFMERLNERYRDKTTGLLIQAVDGWDGSAADKPRGSGTALGAYFISFVDTAVAKDMYESLKRELERSYVGFAFMKEYPSGVAGNGDIDSGPLIAGLSISTTGFALASARVFDDEETFDALYRSAYLFGGPHESDGRYGYVIGGPLGNAIMFAMLTAHAIDWKDGEAAR